MTAQRYVTITLSPAIDCTAVVTGDLAIGTVNCVLSEVRTPGGKGINVARVLALNGCQVTAGGLLGAGETELFDTALTAVGIRSAFLVVDHPTRENIMVADQSGREMKVNRVGFPDLECDWDLLSCYAASLSADADVVVLSGGLPGRFPANTYARLVTQLRTEGKRVVLDASGSALAEAFTAGPHVIKPNRQELAELVGVPLVTEHDVISAARRLAADGCIVIASDGANGAYFADCESVSHMNAPDVCPADTTGAGDALLGQFCADYFSETEGSLSGDVMSRAVAAGTACVECHGAALTGLQRVEELAPRVAKQLIF